LTPLRINVKIKPHSRWIEPTTGVKAVNTDENDAVIKRYLDAYNAFDIDGMMSVIHPDIRKEKNPCHRT